MAIKDYISFYECSRRSTIFHIFKKSFLNTSFADKFSLSLEIVLAYLLLIGYQSYTETKNGFIYIIIITMILLSLFKIITSIKKHISIAFLSYTYKFEKEISFFSTNLEFLQFILFIEEISAKNIFNKDVISRAIQISDTEINNKTTSQVISNPLFIVAGSFFAATFANLISSVFSANGVGHKSMALLLMILGISFLFFIIKYVPEQIQISTHHKLRKFLAWADHLSDDEIEYFKNQLTSDCGSSSTVFD